MVNYMTSGNVHTLGDAATQQISHSVNMARRKLPRSVDVLEDLRRTSGWYLAAWRDYRRLSFDDIQAETGIKKSALSELENGKVRSDGRAPRFNRDTLEAVSKALSITEGMLLDVNPYTANPEWLMQFDALRQGGDPHNALHLVEQLPTKRRA